jgi:hypothetical protein
MLGFNNLNNKLREHYRKIKLEEIANKVIVKKSKYGEKLHPPTSKERGVSPSLSRIFLLFW